MLKKALQTTALAGASALLVACGSSNHDVAAVVSDANLAWNTAFNQGDAKTLVGLYSADATVSPGNGKLLKSHQEITGLFESFFEMGLKNHAIKPVEIYHEGDQVAQVSEWSADLVDQNGDSQQVGGILTSILTPTDSGWQVRSHVWNMAQ